MSSKRGSATVTRRSLRRRRGDDADADEPQLAQEGEISIKPNEKQQLDPQEKPSQLETTEAEFRPPLATLVLHEESINKDNLDQLARTRQDSFDVPFSRPLSRRNSLTFDDHVPPLPATPTPHARYPGETNRTMWQTIKEQVYRSESETNTSFLKTDHVNRLLRFLSIPLELEKFLCFGFIVCLDVFLFQLLFVPLRVVIGTFQLLYSILRRRSINAVYQCDVIRGLMVIVCCYAILSLDPSYIYHNIRGQSVIKLYVIYNMLEIADGLCCSFGQDVLDALFTLVTSKAKLSTLTLYLIGACFYVSVHAVINLHQMITLAVALNSHNNALMTILISNQFVELKGSVYKKSEMINLFQISCSDIRERFQTIIILIVMALRNMSAFHWDTYHFWATVFPAIAIVIGSEILVDWIKHAFVTRFNGIEGSVYSKFRNVLLRDIALSAGDSDVMDYMHRVARRLGFSPMPLCCLFISFLVTSIPWSTSFYGLVSCVTGGSILLAMKIYCNKHLMASAATQSAQIIHEQDGTARHFYETSKMAVGPHESKPNLASK